MFMQKTTPNQSLLKPNFKMMGTNRGMVKRTMPIQSRNIPKKIMINCMPTMTPHLPKGNAKTVFLTN